MEEKEFKEKYFTNNFYWVNESNFLELQRIGLEVGCLCFTMEKETIDWNWSVKNLGFRTYERNGNITVFQREPFLLENETATDYDKMIVEYNNL